MMVAAPMPGRTQAGKTPYKFLGKAISYRETNIRGLLLLPCRQCIGCRLEKSRQWATRLLHETKFHNNACFLTLTYDDDNLPENRSLKPDDLSTFIKDLRARLDYYGKEKVKYLAIGEYGDRTQRPHYHAALFGPFSGDLGHHSGTEGRIPEEPSRSGDPQFSHPDLGAVWPHGLHRFSALTFESAAYVARYCLKKISGVHAPSHYGDRHPEFQRTSQGLGKSHASAWKADIYPADQVVLPGRGEFLPPPYYDRLLEKTDPSLYQDVKKARREAQEKIESWPDWLKALCDRDREGQVKKLVTDATLIRGID